MCKIILVDKSEEVPMKQIAEKKQEKVNLAFVTSQRSYLFLVLSLNKVLAANIEVEVWTSLEEFSFPP